MSAIFQPHTAVPVFESTGTARNGGFFAHHGFWAPGVRLFRKLRFWHKVALIASALALPMMALLWSVVTTAREANLQVQSELAGLGYMDTYVELIYALTDVRNATRAKLGGAETQTDHAQASERLTKSVAEMQRKIEVDHDPMAIAKDFKVLASEWQRARGVAGGVDEQGRTVYGPVVEAANKLFTEIADRSSLSLDPDLDSFNIVEALFIHGPDAIDNLGQVWGWSAYAAGKPDLPPEQARKRAIWGAFAEHSLSGMQAALSVAHEASPEAMKAVDVDRLKALIAYAHESDLAPTGEAAHKSADQVYRDGRERVAALAGLYTQALPALRSLLQARESGLAMRRDVSLTLTALGVLLASYLFVSFGKVLHGGLAEAARHLKAVTSGDLTTSPNPWGRDEAAELMLDLRKMQESLCGMVQRVRRSSDDIVHSSSEIASGAMDLSARTEQAAANLEESAASMEQISSTVKSTSEHTVEAAGVAQHNAEVAADGGRVMQDVVQTMEGIRSSSARIGEIIGTIDGIAFQTNILALNAAVEAARAGEQGRGFAVVAGEVRTLAQRSAEAAREIKTLISRSVQQVEAGTGIVRQAGGTIEDIVQSSQRVNKLLGEIATGAREQSLGISQIGQAVQDLDRMTQQNAALVEETAAASSAMKDQAQTLAQEVTRFRLPAGLALAEQPQAATAAADFDFDKAIDAHRQWKVKLRKAIAEQGQLDADTICRDDRCPLGQWIHGQGGQQWGGRPSFVELLNKHAEFHQVAGGVAKKINQGAYADAERMIGSGSSFALVSTEVSTLLTKAKRGL